MKLFLFIIFILTAGCSVHYLTVSSPAVINYRTYYGSYEFRSKSHGYIEYHMDNGRSLFMKEDIQLLSGNKCYMIPRWERAVNNGQYIIYYAYFDGQSVLYRPRQNEYLGVLYGSEFDTQEDDKR